MWSDYLLRAGFTPMKPALNFLSGAVMINLLKSHRAKLYLAILLFTLCAGPIASGGFQQIINRTLQGAGSEIRLWSDGHYQVVLQTNEEFEIDGHVEMPGLSGAPPLPSAGTGSFYFDSVAGWQFGNSAGFSSLVTGVGGSPGQVQYNNAGALGGISSMTTNGTVVTQLAGVDFLLADPASSTKQADFILSNITAGQTRQVNIPDANSTTVQAGAGAGNNFVQAISAQGVITFAAASGAPGGVAQQFQYNAAGSFAGNSSLVNNGGTGGVVAYCDPSTLNFALIDAADHSKVVVLNLNNLSAATQRTVNFPDANTTTVQSSSAGANQFATAISAQGVVSYAAAVTASSAPANQFATAISAAGALTYAQPAFSNISGTATAGQLPATLVYTGQANTFGAFLQTFQAGANFDLVDPTDTTKIAQFVLSNIATGTTRSVNVPNANSTTVQSASAGANQFATAISAQGVLSFAQPAFSNLSGTATVSQGGTGATSFTAHSALIGEGTSAIAVATPVAGSSVFIGSGSGADPAFSTVLNLGASTALIGEITGNVNIGTQGADAANNIFGLAAVAAFSTVRLARADGATGAFTALASNDQIGSITAQGQINATTLSPVAASIQFFAFNAFTGSDNSSYIKFNTTPSGATAPVEALRIGQNGLFALYKNVTTAGYGVPAIYGQARVTAQTAAVASIATYTNGAADGSFEVSANVLVTASTTHSFTVTCSYTDEGNTSRTLTLTFSQLTGTLLTSITNVQGVGAYEGVVLHIRVKASTSITIGTTGTFTSVTYNAEGAIKQTA
jgi:hypothetical protein